MAATSRTWTSTPEEKRHALQLCRRVGTYAAAQSAIDRFARLWREDTWTRGALRFSFRHVLWSLDKIRERRHRLHVVTPAPASSRRPRPRVPADVAPPPRYDVPRTQPGAASVGDVLALLDRSGALRVRRH